MIENHFDIFEVFVLFMIPSYEEEEKMSIVIKDMEMPETCEECPFHSYHSKGEYICKATPMFYPMNLANSKGMRKDWCPLSKMEEKPND